MDGSIKSLSLYSIIWVGFRCRIMRKWRFSWSHGIFWWFYGCSPYLPIYWHPHVLVYFILNKGAINRWSSYISYLYGPSFIYVWFVCSSQMTHHSKWKKSGFGGRVVGIFTTYLVCHFESSLVHAKKNFLMDHKITFLDWEMKWGKSLYDKYFF